MAVNPSSLGGPKPQWELSDGTPAVGNRLFFYVGGSVNTKQNTYTDSTGGSANTNPIVLNALGMPTTEIWFTAGLSYKVVYAPPGSDDPPNSPIFTVDNLRGINDTSVTISQWVASGVTPTFVSTTSFTMPGDQTTEFHPGRRILTTNTGGSVYSYIVTSVFGALTTVTVVNDGAGVLDSGLSAVSYGLLTTDNPSTPLLTDAYPIVSGSADKTKKLRFEVDGLTTATTRVVTMPDVDINLVYSQQATTSLAGAGEWAIQSEMDAGTASKVATTDLNKISLGTPQATTSGTEKDFTGIPAGTRRITVMFRGVSTNGTSPMIIQIGDAGGPENSGYVAAAGNTGGGFTESTAGFIVVSAAVAGSTMSGQVILCLEDSSDFTWTASGAVSVSGVTQSANSGYKSLTAELTQVRITMANGTDAFDAGEVNIQYER